MARGALLRSLRLACTQQHEALTPHFTQMYNVFGMSSRQVVQQARSVADAQPDHKAAEEDGSTSEV